MATTVEDIRNHCSELEKRRKGNLKFLLGELFRNKFLGEHRDWPGRIKFDEEFIEFSKEKNMENVLIHNMDKVLIHKVFEDLGFVVKKNPICLLVPDYEEGKELTFAQYWKKKIHDNYESYIAEENEKAEEIYSEFLSNLAEVPEENIINCDGYAVFKNVKSRCEFPSIQAQMTFKNLMLADGITELFVENDGDECQRFIRLENLQSN